MDELLTKTCEPTAAVLAAVADHLVGAMHAFADPVEPAGDAPLTVLLARPGRKA